MKIRFCIFLLILSVFPAFSQDRLTPVDHSVGSEILSKYYEKIDRLLMETDEYSYAFQIRPSFTPESCLLYSPDKKELVFRIASRNIWYSKGRIGVKKYHCPITSVISDKLDSLFSSAVFSASPDAEVLGLDGTTYEIRTNGGKDIAECWSPDDDGSNCDRLVRVLEELCDIVKNKDVNRIEGLVPEIEALTVDFINHIGQEVPQSLPYYDRVSSYLDSLVRDGGSYRAFRLFSLEEIPALLSFADDTREIKSPPANLLSSYLPSSCSVGVYSLWLIDCIRRNEVLIGQRMEQTSEDAPLSPEYARWGRFSLAPELSHGGLIHFGSKDYAFYQSQAAEAYRFWWNSGSIESILSRDPLEFTGLHWY